MSAIKLASFTGEQPRVVPRLLPPTAARAAINARLDDGALTPYRRPTLEAELEDGPYESIYRHGEDWLAFEGVVNAAPGPVADDRLYYTGDGVPKLRVGEDVYPLAVPRPGAAPTASLDGTADGDVQSRIYVYTFVTEFGEESEPSPASNEVEWTPGHDSVTLSGIADAPAEPERGIAKQRFYRSQTGSVGTDLYFIAERAVSGSNFVDDIPVDAFAEPLPSRHWNAPPDDLAGLIALPNGMMAGFVGRRLYFSEPWRPHAWPEAYVLTSDFPIVALAASGTLVWVLTTGFPYRVAGTTPDTMVMDRVEANLPCINPRGVVDLGHAIAWPSHNGLAVADAGGARLASTNLFSPREWRRLNPATMRAGQIEGRWIGSYSGTNRAGEPVAGSLIIDLSGQSFLIRTDVEARHWHHDLGSGFLFFLALDGVTIRQFDSPGGDTDELYWRSKQFVLPKPENFGSILIETGVGISQDQIDSRQAEIAAVIAANEALIAEGPIGGELAGETLGATTLAGDLLAPLPAAIGSEVTVGVYADGKLAATVGTLDRVTRLPSGFKARTWEIDVFTDITIDQVTMARTVDEMKQAGGGP